MSLFSKILSEKLKTEPTVALKECNSGSDSPDITGLSEQLMAWLNESKLTQKFYYNVEGSSYSIYKKDPLQLKKQKEESEKKAFSHFLAGFSSEKQREAARFFYEHGARSFISKRRFHLKKDYRKLALRLHPDRYFNEIPSVQTQFQEEFRRLSESYNTLFSLFSE